MSHAQQGPHPPPAGAARVVFMGTPDFAVPTLRRLLETQRVVGVFTRRDRPAGRGRALRASPVKVVAEAAGLPVVQPRSLRRGADAAPGLEALRALRPDVVVVAAYGLILPTEVLRAAPFGALNVHASLLPRWRGAAPVHHALLAGDANTGATIMQMDEGLDTGPMLTRVITEITDDETAGELTDRLAALGAELLATTLPRWLAGELEPQPQDEAAATLAPMLRKADGEIDWRRDAAYIARQVRAMAPWPGAYSFDPEGGRLKIHQAEALAASDVPPGSVATPASAPTDAVEPREAAALPDPADAPAGATSPAPGPGRLRQLQREGRAWPVVRCGAGWLLLRSAQAAGARAMDGDVLLRGRPGWLDGRLGARDDGDDHAADRA